MTRKIEVLDSLCGTGKTTAIFKHMADNLDRPWLYISPMKSEVDQRVNEEAGEHGMQFYVPNEDIEETKTEQILEFLRLGYDIACTHNLMHRFTKEHLHEIKRYGYQIVCDETLDLISGYNIGKDDWDFLKGHDLVSIDDVTGKVSFKDQAMGDKAKYAEFKKLCDIGCLYSAKRSERMLVTQVSIDMIDLCSRFILLTYNYKGSVMESFLSMNGYNFEVMNIPLFKTNAEVIAKTKELLTFVDTPSSDKVRNSFKLSKSWWATATVAERKVVADAIRSLYRNNNANSDNIIYTLPADINKLKSFKIEGLSKTSWLACNTRATNNYDEKDLLIHCYDLHPNVSVKAYLQDAGFDCDDKNYAINMIVQWLYRGAIRNQKPMRLCVMSKRMQKLLFEWLNNI